MKLKKFPKYKMLGYTDCLRSCICNLLCIPARSIPNFTNDYIKSNLEEYWVTFFNRRFKEFGFQIYQVESLKDYSIGIVKTGEIHPKLKLPQYHAIICLNNKPFFDPATGEKPKYRKGKILMMFNVRKVN